MRRRFDALIYPIQYDTFAEVQAMKNKPVIIPPTQPSPIPSKNKSPFPFPIPTGGVGTPSSQGTICGRLPPRRRIFTGNGKQHGRQEFTKQLRLYNLTSAFTNIANELRQFYSLGYYPAEEAPEGKRRKIKVRVNKSGLTVQAREGYVVGKKKEKSDK